MVLEHVRNGTYPLHVRDDISPRMIWYRVRAVVFAPAESLRKTDGQTPFGVYGTADTNALKSARLGFGQGDDAQRSGTRLGQLKRLANNLASSADILASDLAGWRVAHRAAFINRANVRKVPQPDPCPRGTQQSISEASTEWNVTRVAPFTHARGCRGQGGRCETGGP